VPDLLPDLGIALGAASAITVHTGGLTPSTLTVPAVTP
jgi:hypothetical protein